MLLTDFFLSTLPFTWFLLLALHFFGSKQFNNVEVVESKPYLLESMGVPTVPIFKELRRYLEKQALMHILQKVSAASES